MPSGSLTQLSASHETKKWVPLAGGASQRKPLSGGGPAPYYPAGSPKLKTPCNAYGPGKAVDFGHIHDNWEWAGPMLGPSPGNSGQMTGGARHKSKRRSHRRRRQSATRKRRS